MVNTVNSIVLSYKGIWLFCFSFHSLDLRANQHLYAVLVSGRPGCNIGLTLVSLANVQALTSVPSHGDWVIGTILFYDRQWSSTCPNVLLLHTAQLTYPALAPS